MTISPGMTDDDDQKVWDRIVGAGWGPVFAASVTLMALRSNHPEVARCYYMRLRRLAGAWGDDPANAPLANDDFAPTVLRKLWEMLTPEERERLR